MPITTNNPVGPIDSMAALRALLSGGSQLNAANPQGFVQGAANRDARLGEMTHNLSLRGPNFSTGATPQDVQDLNQDIQEDPMTGAAAHQNVAEEEALNQKMQQYGRPDVAEARNAAETFALKKLLMPLQVKGQYDVEAAKQRAESQAARDQTLMGGRADVANITQGGQNERNAAGIDARIRAQKLKDLQTRRTKATGNGLGNLFGLTGPSDLANIDAEIAALSGDQSQAEGAAPAQAGNAPPAPAGWRYVPKPGGGWTAVPE
jgi:hypothetical protein